MSSCILKAIRNVMGMLWDAVPVHMMMQTRTNFPDTDACVVERAYTHKHTRMCMAPGEKY